MTAVPKMRTPFHRLPNSKQAAILCNDSRFQEFAAKRCGYPDSKMSPKAAAQYVRTICKVTSRRELDKNDNAARRLQELRSAFDVWRGKISAPPSRN